MKSLLMGAAFAALLGGTAIGQPAPPPGPYGHPLICLRPFDVPGPGGLMHTKVLDPQTILFYTRDGKVWKNTLKTPCRGLMFHGFSFVTRQDEVCENSTGIRVIESGEVCTLGRFTQVVQPAAR